MKHNPEKQTGTAVTWLKKEVRNFKPRACVLWVLKGRGRVREEVMLPTTPPPPKKNATANVKIIKKKQFSLEEESYTFILYNTLEIDICVIPPGWDTICDGVNCYIRKCTIYYPWLWLLINIVVISDWRWRDWFHSDLKNNCECALVIKDNRWYIYGCNNWHRHKSCPNLVEWPIYFCSDTSDSFKSKIQKCFFCSLLVLTYHHSDIDNMYTHNTLGIIYAKLILNKCISMFMKMQVKLFKTSKKIFYFLIECLFFFKDHTYCILCTWRILLSLN